MTATCPTIDSTVGERFNTVRAEDSPVSSCAVGRAELCQKQ